jgi:hypothetical protein
MGARPRGFIDRWQPRAETQALLDQVIRVLAEYAEQLPLTLRQIFCRLVGAYGYQKKRAGLRAPGRDAQYVAPH